MVQNRPSPATSSRDAFHVRREDVGYRSRECLQGRAPRDGSWMDRGRVREAAPVHVYVSASYELRAEYSPSQRGGAVLAISPAQRVGVAQQRRTAQPRNRKTARRKKPRGRKTAKLASPLPKTLKVRGRHDTHRCLWPAAETRMRRRGCAQCGSASVLACGPRSRDRWSRNGGTAKSPPVPSSRKARGGGARWSQRQQLERTRRRHSRVESSRAESGRDDACHCAMLGLGDDGAERDEQPTQTLSAQSPSRGEIGPNVRGANVVASDRDEPIWGGMVHVGAWTLGPAQRGMGSPQS
ncbi:hypothetical protein CERSUDRAFT_111630 [Gelatoporia subvermispora B]|uniref:Uncharacterized protein n=1 Tax=Ceriporiopsis subvermispora (strain B) TaxID=914234 RepID=M2RQB0_CERS8|nr:hypothetical protein CERSUDRAFT_111630 [Gelatoporia subvermispora B]